MDTGLSKYKIVRHPARNKTVNIRRYVLRIQIRLDLISHIIPSQLPKRHTNKERIKRLRFYG
jgi:hypothetical protein